MTSIPQALRDERRWLVWRLDRGRKPPVDQHGKPLEDWVNPTTWLTFEQSATQSAALPGQASERGLGFVLGAGWAGLDLDGCRDPKTGDLDPRAQVVLDVLVPDAYAEVSPSGLGLKVFGRGDGWVELTFPTVGKVAVSTKKVGYFCVTGQALPGRSALPELPLERICRHFSESADKPEPRAARPRPLPPAGTPVPAGSQDDVMTREARALRGRGYDGAAIADALWGLIQAGRFPAAPGREPWTRRDAEEKARRVCEKFEAGSAGHELDADDAGIAAYFAATRGGRLRFDHRKDRWLVWDGVRWAPDRDGLVTRMIVDTARELVATHAADRDALKRLIKYADENKIRAVRTVAKDTLPIASVGDEWDRNPWLLGAPNGVVDLRSGALRAGTAEDNITMQTNAAYNPDAKCPTWEAFIVDIFKDKPEGFAEYVQRALGYSITGDMREEVFFILVGIGRNGKGTTVNTVHDILGDYADSLKFASLEIKRASDGGQGPTPDLAKLHRKRFVIASEGSGAALNTALVKLITGRDPLTTRGMYERQEYTFNAELKLWLTAQTDKRPSVRDDSEGFWSRPHVLDFSQKYRGREDMTLKDRLLEEAEGILAWLVRGCLAWQKDGLRAPSLVTQAAEDYRRDQEPLAEFYEARCVLGPKEFTTKEELRAAYVAFCSAERIHFSLGSKRFFQEIGKRFAEGRASKVSARGFVGIGLAPTTSKREPGQDDVPF